MPYGSNLITNPSAETMDTTGWVVDNVTVEENTTLETTYEHILNDEDGWLGEYDHKLTVEGPAGDYAFIFASDSDAYMTQILYASDIGDQPASFQFNCKFKIANAQDTWDPLVKGWAKLDIIYSDNSHDWFFIPFVKGLDHVNRNLFNFWLLVQNVCIVDANKTLVSAEIKIETFDFGLKVDYIELRKEEE